MTKKNLITLGVAAVVLGTAAYLSGSGRKMKAPSLVGKPVMADFDLSQIAKIEIGGAKKMTLASTGLPTSDGAFIFRPEPLR